MKDKSKKSDAELSREEEINRKIEDLMGPPEDELKTDKNPSLYKPQFDEDESLISSKIAASISSAPPVEDKKVVAVDIIDESAISEKDFKNFVEYSKNHFSSDLKKIIVSEIPYQVNKASLIEKIAELVQDKKIEGIRDLRDESNKDGVRVVVELKKDSYPKKILNQLYSLTALQTTFHYNMLALVDGIVPRILNVKNILEEFGITNERKEQSGKRKERRRIEAISNLDMIGDDRPLEEIIKDKIGKMKEAAKDLEFELAAILRDEIRELSARLKSGGEEKKKRVGSRK